MLVIRRRPGESTLIGPDIEIEILELSGGQVKLGIRAPREVLILRKEVKLTRDVNMEASRTVSPDSVENLARRLRP